MKNQDGWTSSYRKKKFYENQRRKKEREEQKENAGLFGDNKKNKLQ